VFYSISNCPRGLGGRLVRQLPDQQGGSRRFHARSAAVDLRHASRRRRTSPSGSSASGVDGVGRARREDARRSPRSTGATVARSGDRRKLVHDPLSRAAAWYYLRAKTPRGVPIDPVRASISATAPGSNGSISWATARSGRWPVARLMVNYLYDLRISRRTTRLCAAAHGRCCERGDAPVAGAGARRCSGGGFDRLASLVGRIFYGKPTQVGCSRLGQYRVPISGKPEIGVTFPENARSSQFALTPAALMAARPFRDLALHEFLRYSGDCRSGATAVGAGSVSRCWMAGCHRCDAASCSFG